MASVGEPVESHVVWEGKFSADERDRMLHEDLMAAETVPTLLAAIVVMGTLGMFLSVWFTL